jgi:FkbM family methyltransferase
MHRSLKRLLTAPYYRHNPRQVLVRLLRALRPSRDDPETLVLPWGIPIRVSKDEFIGRSIWATGVHDLAVSEAIWRTLRPGDTAVDAGANIGYMTGLMALRVGSRGKVLAFEPHPELFDCLRYNSLLYADSTLACQPELYDIALSDRNGNAALQIDNDWERHHGVAHLANESPPSNDVTTIDVQTRRLDDIANVEEISLLKLDVEGHETNVLAGASRLLAERKIKTVIYEERGGMAGPSHEVLSNAGFTLFYLDSNRAGAFIAPLRTPRITPAPDFLATLDPEETRRRFSDGGWQLFRRR